MESLKAISFYIISIILILGSVGVILSKKTSTIIMDSFVAFLGFGFLYYMLNSVFNATVQILIFAVGVVVLMLYLIVLTPQKSEKNLWLAFGPRMFFGLMSIFFIMISVLIAVWGNWMERVLGLLPEVSQLNRVLQTTFVIGEKLFTDYVAVFLIIAVILFVLVLGMSLTGVFKRNEEPR